MQFVCFFVFCFGRLPVIQLLIDKFQSSDVLFNGRLDCCCRPGLFSLEKETPSRGSTFTVLALVPVPVPVPVLAPVPVPVPVLISQV